jgi:hypothetical protein
VVFNIRHWRKLNNPALRQAFNRPLHIIMSRLNQIGDISAGHRDNIFGVNWFIRSPLVRQLQLPGQQIA